MLRATLVAALAGLTFAALAEDLPTSTNSAPTPPPAVVTKTAGQPVTMVFPDGREAELKVVHADSGVVSQKIEITSSDCGNWGMTCNYKFSFRRFWVALVWTKNPDTSRVGQIVKRGNTSTDSNGNTIVNEDNLEELKSDSAIATGLIPNQIKKIAQGLPPHELECGNFSWLPAGTKEAPAQQVFTRWDNDDNNMNRETKNNENGPEGGVLELHMVRVRPNALQITSALPANGVVKGFDVLTFAPMLDLAVLQPDGGICSAGLSTHGLTDLLPIYDGLENKRPDYASAPPYLYGQDETLDMANVKSDMQSWFRQDSSVVYK